MKKLIAIHEIVRNDGKGQRETVAPGKQFSGSDEEAAFLLSIGAAKLAAPAVERIAPAAADSTDSTDSTDTTDTTAPARDLSKMLKPELLAIAAELEIEGHQDMTVPQLREAIEAEEAAAEDESMI